MLKTANRHRDRTTFGVRVIAILDPIDGIPVSEAVQMLEGALAANCLALKRFMET